MIVRHLKYAFETYWPLIIFTAFYGIVQLSLYLKIGHWLAIALIAPIVILISIWYVNERRFEKYLNNIISKTKYDFIREIKDAVEALSVSDIDGYILVPKFERKHDAKTHKIFLRETLNKHPWENKVLTFEFKKDISDFSFNISSGNIDDEDHDHFVIRAPRTKTQSNVSKNHYDLRWVYKKSDRIRNYFNQTFSKNPEKAYEKLLANEGCFQTRTGTKSSWVQGQEYKSCTICKNRMHQIIQIATHEFGYRDLTIYILGCPEHPLETEFVWQCT